jgi:hypothetical protein
MVDAGGVDADPIADNAPLSRGTWGRAGCKQPGARTARVIVWAVKAASRTAGGGFEWGVDGALTGTVGAYAFAHVDPEALSRTADG